MRIPKTLIVLTCTLPDDSDPFKLTTTEVVGIYERREDADEAAAAYASGVRDDTGEEVEYEHAFKFTTVERKQITEGKIIFEAT